MRASDALADPDAAADVALALISMNFSNAAALALEPLVPAVPVGTSGAACKQPVMVTLPALLSLRAPGDGGVVEGCCSAGGVDAAGGWVVLGGCCAAIVTLNSAAAQTPDQIDIFILPPYEAR